ncbi:unnamed protein product [Caenorhabditis nigoni]
MTDLSQYSPILKTTSFSEKNYQLAITTPSTNTPSESPANVSFETETQDSIDETKLETGLNDQLLGKRVAADTDLSSVNGPPEKRAYLNSANLYFSFSAYHIHCMPISKRKKRKKRSLKNDLGDSVPIESAIKGNIHFRVNVFPRHVSSSRCSLSEPPTSFIQRPANAPASSFFASSLQTWLCTAAKFVPPPPPSSAY